jgi:hypothetical protein
MRALGAQRVAELREEEEEEEEEERDDAAACVGEAACDGRVWLVYNRKYRGVVGEDFPYLVLHLGGIDEAFFFLCAECVACHIVIRKVKCAFFSSSFFFFC